MPNPTAALLADLKAAEQRATELAETAEQAERHAYSVTVTLGRMAKRAEAAEQRAEAAEQRATDMEKALERVRENAKAWHGSEGLDTGHARALAVIAEWCDAALSAREEAQT